MSYDDISLKKAKFLIWIRTEKNEISLQYSVVSSLFSHM